MRKVERNVERKVEPFSIWKLATTELKLNYPEAQKTHFAPKNSLRENSRKRETSRKIQEKFKKNSRAVFQNYECCKKHCGHKINSEYFAIFALYSLYIILLMNSKKRPLHHFAAFNAKGEKFTSRNCKRLQEIAASREIRRKSGGVEQWKAQNERRVQTVLPAFLLHSSLELLSWTPLLLSCSPEFFYFFYIPNGYWSRTSFFRT